MPRPCRGRGGAGRARRRGDARQTPRRASTRTDRDGASGRREPMPTARHGRHDGTSKRRRVRVLWNYSGIIVRWSGVDQTGREPERTPAGAGRWLAFASSETGLARASGSFVPRLLSSDPPRLSRVKRFLSPREKIQAVTEIFGFDPPRHLRIQVIHSQTVSFPSLFAQFDIEFALLRVTPSRARSLAASSL